MNHNPDDQHLICLDIEGVRPSYELTETDDPSGFTEELVVMIKVRDPSAAQRSSFGIIHIKGSRAMESQSLQRIEAESYPGTGLVTSTVDGLVVQTIMPFDAAWNIAGAVKSGMFGTVTVNSDPIEGVGSRAFLRGLEFHAA